MDRTSFNRTLDLVQEALGDRYLVTGPLAQGGMSLLLRGRQTLLDQPVAIKVMDAQAVGNRALRERFVREARILASLQVPQISRVYDAGALRDGRLYLVMELLQGENLEAISERGPMSLGLAARVLMQVCDGLAAAHDKGIIHRDLKPENVFIIGGDDGPCAKLIDFGIAKDTADRNEVTGTYTIVGSPLYVPPEQIASSRTVDKRADIWAMGIMLYQLVLQRHPFEDPSLALLLNKIQNEPLPPFPSDSDPMFEIIVERCLAKQPEDRYSSATELKEALASLADQEPLDLDEDMPTLGPRPAPVVGPRAPDPAANRPAAPAAPPARRAPYDHRQEPETLPPSANDDQPISSTENTIQTSAPTEARLVRPPISEAAPERSQEPAAVSAPKRDVTTTMPSARHPPAAPRPQHALDLTQTQPEPTAAEGARTPQPAPRAPNHAQQALGGPQPTGQGQQDQGQQPQGQGQQPQGQGQQPQGQGQQPQGQGPQGQGQQPQGPQSTGQQLQGQQPQDQQSMGSPPGQGQRQVQKTIPIGRPGQAAPRADGRPSRGHTIPLMPGQTPPPTAAVAAASSRGAPVFAEPLPPLRGQIPTVIVRRQALWPYVALGVGIVLVLAAVAFALTR